MSKMPIITGKDNPILLRKSKEVSKIDRSVLKLIKDMKETLLSDDGVGLSAPQVGVNMRVTIIALQKHEEISKDYTLVPMINPKIITFSDDTCVCEEGCLSLPGEFMNVERAKSITVLYLNERGEEVALVLSDINARIVQHEVDHLNGILITERAKETIPLAS